MSCNVSCWSKEISNKKIPLFACRPFRIQRGKIKVKFHFIFLFASNTALLWHITIFGKANKMQYVLISLIN